MEEKLICTYIIRIAVILCFLFVFVGCKPFPNKTEINILLEKASTEKDEKTRTERYTQLLVKLSTSESPQDDSVVGYATEKLTLLYKSTHDEALLNAIDSIKIDGGFANYIAGFYKEACKEKEFINRCKTNPKTQIGLKRCIGLSLSEEEYTKAIQK